MPRPLIGVVANFYDTVPGQALAHNRLNVGYSDSVMLAGGLPVILPVIDDEAAIEQFLDTVCGVLFGGGYDIDPARYGQPRHDKTHILPDRLDKYVFRVFEHVDRRADMPALGICLGCQLFNVARGGTLHQHVPDVPPAASVGRLNHFAKVTQYAGGRESHVVHIQPGTRLAMACNRNGSLLVNSGHHQAVDRLGRGLVASAFSEDGLIEAVEDPSREFFVAVQWHPEELADRAEHLALFGQLVQAAARR